MKILLVQDTDWIKRNPIQHNHLMERMVLRGHEVRVIDYPILWKEDEPKGLFSNRQVFRVSRILKNAEHEVIRPGILKIPFLDYVSMLFTYRKEIDRQIKESKPDVIIGDGVLIPHLAFKLAKKYNIKTVYYCIDLDYKLIPSRILQPLGKILESKNMNNADLVLSINEGLRDYTIRMGASRAKTRVIRAGIDSQTFNPNIDGKGIREEYGIKRDDIILFFMGWLYNFSGLKEVALELAKIREEKPNVKLLIVGDGDAFDDLQRIKAEYNLDSQMILTGKQPYEKIPEFIAAADICLLPAYPDEEIMRDIVPIKMYEYMAMSKPVITTELQGIMKEFGDDNGVIYVNKTEDALKKAIELIDNESMDEEGMKARMFVANNEWDILTDEFEETLESVFRQ